MKNLSVKATSYRLVAFTTLVAFTKKFRINNEIENLIKMSKVDFEKQIFEKNFFLELWNFFLDVRQGGPLLIFFCSSKTKKFQNSIFQNPLLTFLSDFRFRY